MVLQVRGNQASVLGQVNRPGRFPIEVADMRLTDLLAMAGGTAANGADIVVVTGTRNGQPFRKEVDLPTAVRRRRPASKDMLIQNGDVIWVDRQPLVYIYGEVQRPGPMRLERGMTLMQALATGGGLTQRGTEKGIRVHRKAADGKVQVMQPEMDDKRARRRRGLRAREPVLSGSDAHDLRPVPLDPACALVGGAAGARG